MDAPNPFPLLRDAAMGSVEAQRALAEMSLAMAKDQDDEGLMLCLLEGLVFARLAAAHGDPADEGRVISMLALCGEICAASQSPGQDVFMGEATARISRLADQGVEIAENNIIAQIEASTPGAVRLAKMFEERLRQ